MAALEVPQDKPEVNPCHANHTPFIPLILFAHNTLENWMNGYKERFDVWHDGGVRGLVIGRMSFDGGVRCWTPDAKIYERFGESPPADASSDPDKERQLHATLDDNAGRGWPVFIFGGG